MILQIKLISYQKHILNKYIIKGLIQDLSQFKYRCSVIALPNTIQKYTVLKSPHVNKKAREQFQLCTHKRLLDIYTSSSRTVDALSKLDLPSGVDVEIKA